MLSRLRDAHMRQVRMGGDIPGWIEGLIRAFRCRITTFRLAVSYPVVVGLAETYTVQVSMPIPIGDDIEGGVRLSNKPRTTYWPM